MFNDLYKGITEPLKSARGITSLLVISFLIFALLILIPVWTTPGNDVLFQLSILEPFVLGLMIALSVANGLLITMQLYIRSEVKHKADAAHTAAHAGTAFSVVVSSLVSTVACAACYSAVLSILGLGTTAFIVEHRLWFAVAAMAISFAAIYYSAKRINNHCAVCTIKAS